MIESKVIESLNNAWSALNEKYQSSPSEEMRCAINLVGKICAEIKSAFEKNKKCEGTQISIQEWLDWLNADVVN